MENSLSDSDKTGLHTKALITPSAPKIVEFNNMLKRSNYSGFA